MDSPGLQPMSGYGVVEAVVDAVAGGEEDDPGLSEERYLTVTEEQ